MDALSLKIPEIHCGSNVNEIPWNDAVVWSLMPPSDSRAYEWITREHIRYVTWTNGNASILPSNESMLASLAHAIILQAPFIWVGKNVNVG